MLGEYDREAGFACATYIVFIYFPPRSWSIKDIKVMLHCNTIVLILVFEESRLGLRDQIKNAKIEFFFFTEIDLISK